MYETLQPIGATVQVVSTYGVPYIVTSPSLNYYIITLFGTPIDSAFNQQYGAFDTSVKMDKASFTNP